MGLLQQIPAWLKNKYLLTLAVFIVWMLFFDDRDLYVTVHKQRQELQELKTSKTYFEEQIANSKKQLDQLKVNALTIEKYAREKYLMKRDNEDLFVIQPAKASN